MRRAKTTSQTAVTIIKMPGSERKDLGKQVCWREGVGSREERPLRESGLGAQTLSQHSALGEPKGWARARKELNLIWGFAV